VREVVGLGLEDILHAGTRCGVDHHFVEVRFGYTSRLRLEPMPMVELLVGLQELARRLVSVADQLPVRV
jgi:hypothetical protein